MSFLRVSQIKYQDDLSGLFIADDCIIDTSAMLAKQRLKQLAPAVCTVLLIAIFSYTPYHFPDDNWTELTPGLFASAIENDPGPEIFATVDETDPTAAVFGPENFKSVNSDVSIDTVASPAFPDSAEQRIEEEYGRQHIEAIAHAHNASGRDGWHEIYSLTTQTEQYFSIDLKGEVAYNPNIIPHPTQPDKWVVIAQREFSDIKIYEELVCVASFVNDVLVCIETPTVAPIAPSIDGVCEGELDFMNHCPACKGARDARVFYGPDTLYVVYGSQSRYACLGIWLQDARTLLEPFRHKQLQSDTLFQQATELLRPAPWRTQEKNYFIFWDTEGKMFVHHDIWPNRVFAQLGFDGSVGENLATHAEKQDQTCLAKLMPQIKPEEAAFHQATNSLSITLCKRSDPNCVVDDSNTFIMHVFHLKTKTGNYSGYAPWTLLFQRTAPFVVHAISQQPMWIHGRDNTIKEGADRSEFLYVTSMSWKTHGQRYHGYVDDPLFLSFGLDDWRAGGIDILAGDLLQDLGYC